MGSVQFVEQGVLKVPGSTNPPASLLYFDSLRFGLNHTNSPAIDGSTYSNAVTALATSNLLTTTGDQVPTLGTGGVPGVLFHTASNRYRFVSVFSVSTTQIALDKNLNLYFNDLPTGTLNFTFYTSFSGLQSQHLGSPGYKAYADLLFNSKGMDMVRNQAIVLFKAGEVFETAAFLGALPLDYWLVGGGLSTSAINYNVDQNITNVNGAIHSRNTKVVMISPVADGQYATYTYPLEGRSCIIHFSTGIISTSRLEGTVKVFADSLEVYSKDFGLSITLHSVYVPGAQSVEIRVQQKGVGSPLITLHELSFTLVTPPVQKAIPDNSRVLLMGDSWFDELGNGGFARPDFANRMRVLSSSSTFESKYSRGGTTSKYGNLWIATAIADVKPDVVVFHYGINDYNSSTGSNLSNELDPDGNSIDINIASLTEYKMWMGRNVTYCLDRGISVVVCLMPPTGSGSQAQAAAIVGWMDCLGGPSLIEEHIHRATDDEISNVASRVNTVNKYTGRVILNSEDNVVYYATGPNAADSWRPVNANVTSGITASTTQTQGNGALVSTINEISTVALANDTVTLPTAIAGAEVNIINNGVNILRIFPASGDNLGAGLNVATTLAAGSNVRFIAYDVTNWEVI